MIETKATATTKTAPKPTAAPKDEGIVYIVNGVKVRPDGSEVK